LTGVFDEFRAMHRPGDPFVLPNAWDFTSAAALADAGFRAVGTTSLGVAAAAGLPDAEGRTRAETYALTRRIGGLPCLVTVDIEGGFSDHPEDVARLAYDLASVGAVGVNIEDGRSDGTLAPVEHQRDLIRAIKRRVPHLFVNARTDTHWLRPNDPDLHETVERVRAYRDAGADGVFVPGIVDPVAIRAVVGATDAPLNVLFMPGRHSITRLADLGVARISTGSLLFRAALNATVATARALASGDEVSGALPSYADVTALVARGQSAPERVVA
jgi:2-methylisocitrate lyase-like PEP mutase family enzyme